MANTEKISLVEKFFHLTDRIEAAKNSFFDNEKKVIKALAIHAIIVVVFVIGSFIYYAPK